jgi:hypothetical protein
MREEVVSKKPVKRKPANRKGEPWPRARRKHAKGIRLTSDRAPFTLLPSDFALAMRQPPGTPTKATRKADPPLPTTQIPELNAIEFSAYAYQVVIEAIEAADRVQVKRINPSGGPNLRYRIELAAAFLAMVMDQARGGAEANKAAAREASEFVNLALNIAIRRAEEIYGQGGA